jgi:hypothetical protein
VTEGRQRNKKFCAQNIFENLIMLMEIISILKERLSVGKSISMNSCIYTSKSPMLK